MFKEYWKFCIGFVVLVTMLSIFIVRHGIDAQVRGYPLPFVTISSGLEFKPSLGWNIWNLLISIVFYMAVAVTALGASRMSAVPAKAWLWGGLAVLLMSGVAAYWMWRGISSPITRADIMDRATSTAIAIRHLVAIGVLTSVACFFVCCLKAFLGAERAN
jgi:hypothetical protein